MNETENQINQPTDQKEVATLAAGCFWCVEAVFQKLAGVESVVSGYMGGDLLNPTYKQVCSGQTGHAEVIQITFDPERISFDDLLHVFWKTHDPTTLNRQGNDVGTQYRSAIFFHNATQQAIATEQIESLNREVIFPSPIVTEVTPASTFYPAEAEHQNYWRTQGQGNGYCMMVIPPKLEKLKAAFGDKLKE